MLYCRTIKKTESRPPLRQYLVDGDFFIGAALGTTLTKLSLRYISLVHDVQKHNRFCTDAMLIMASILHLGKSGKHTSSSMVYVYINICMYLHITYRPAVQGYNE